MPSSNIASKFNPLPPGVYTPVVTIYEANDPSQQVDYGAMYVQCQGLISAGIHGLVYLGTNGELALLTPEERKTIIQTAARAIADLKRPDYPLVAGISAQSTFETILNAEDAASAGANFALLLPPSYWVKALSSNALLAYYRAVADASPIPIIVYNFPGVTAGIDLDSDQIAALASHPNISAVKLTCGNVGKLTRLTSKFNHDQFGVFGGSSDYLLPTLHAGGSGCVTGLGNIFPGCTSAVYDLFQAGRVDEAKKLQDDVANAEWACKKGIACTKYGAWYYFGRGRGLDNEASWNMRKPYEPLGDAMKQWTLETLAVLERAERERPWDR
ncbi:putative 4-hydroxy-2-oxoglutarate aldolase like protein [Verticillium longisporum]|uniref:Dihydrodipicolinate synthase n=3 Tax=Verticillium TaxID=1036719 RepID=G2XBB9_VERDV|nr:dihydrodipicolinate synthase [Verticillium dahliae VdLs.17]KAF3349312.1 Putative vacuolar protein sorting-associated protein [Verticillium dahliae VDG2]KAF3356721.1 Ubiquitin-conjugating enzyme E2-16 kDa [Verticillium dahliae VDG1]KAG7133249.1 putative 4-hydroxy-2-oxoglutarate aldolase like protein [Verticillium longisporum]KAH6687053.1 dihydrodipicolinate synthase [Verticillium dahliae]EGY16093.1 dihydrodipicolinate synthase [Verticillium dahliae VdLs.17]